MDIEKITKDITEAGETVTNKFRTLENIISAGIKANNALADIQYELDTQYAAICLRPECKDEPTAHINRLYKSETAELHRLKTIARGYKNTLKNMEYGGYK